MELGMWSSIIIVTCFSFFVIFLDEYVVKPWRAAEVGAAGGVGRQGGAGAAAHRQVGQGQRGVSGGASARPRLDAWRWRARLRIAAIAVALPCAVRPVAARRRARAATSRCEGLQWALGALSLLVPDARRWPPNSRRGEATA